eukprot:gene8070-17519_t
MELKGVLRDLVPGGKRPSWNKISENPFCRIPERFGFPALQLVQ